MKTIIAMAVLLTAPWAFAQETIMPPAPESELKIVPAVKTTASVYGEDYTVARDEDGKIVFVKTEVKEKYIRPILIQVEEPENNQ
tara:strand:- start:4599 stop:4853 length:255 start_codon:yes stop_codon:yes gene_type:complete